MKKETVSVLDILFTPIFESTFAGTDFLICTAAALAFGIMFALTFCRKDGSSRSFRLTLILLPAAVQTVILLVNGNVGTGVAVMGAFSLVRFRSVPGNAKEIAAIFMAMTAGLACAEGYIGIALIFTVIMCAAALIAGAVKLPRKESPKKELRITIPESLNYTDAFDDVFEKYLKDQTLMSVKTTNMGSLFRLTYTVELNDISKQKEFIDELRCRNGNLEISLGMASTVKEAL